MSNDGTREDGKKKLSLESLDQVVGGIGVTPTVAKKKGADADVLAEATSGLGFAPIDFSGGKSPGIWTDPTKSQDPVKGFFISGLEDAIKGKNAASVGAALDHYVSTNGTALGPSRWTAAYDCVLGSGFHDGTKLSADVQEALKGQLRTHITDITSGVLADAAKSTATAETVLKQSLNQTSDVVAHLLSKADNPQMREDLLDKAKAGYEAGLNALENTRQGKAINDLIHNPKSEDAWKTAAFEVGIGAVTPTEVSVVHFLSDQMAHAAVLKHIGLGQYDPQLQQAARAVAHAIDTATSAAVDLYKNGFVAAYTFGLDVKGIMDIGKNAADFGKAIGSGDVDGMGKAAKALVVDAFNDIKDGVERFYVGGATKAASWTKTIVMGLLDDLGATPYAEMAVQETRKAFEDFGAMAKNGSEAAIHALTDFATHDVAGTAQHAIDTLADIGKSGVQDAEKAINALGDVAKSGAHQAELAVNALADIGKSGVHEAEKAIDTLADVAKSGAVYANVAIDQLKHLSTSAEAAAHALEDVAKSGVDYAERAYNDVKDGLSSAADTVRKWFGL